MNDLFLIFTYRSFPMMRSNPQLKLYKFAIVMYKYKIKLHGKTSLVH